MPMLSRIQSLGIYILVTFETSKSTLMGWFNECKSVPKGTIKEIDALCQRFQGQLLWA